MDFLDLYLEINRELSSVLSSLGLKDVEPIIEIPPDKRFGDFSTPLPLRLAKVLKRNPWEIAEDFIKKIDIGDILNKMEIAGAGYINFYGNRTLMYTQFIDSLYSSGVSALKVNLGNGLKVRIEHTSVNPNKAIHVGHARNMILGDALARILKATGYKVDILNYIDDTGVQVADVILGFKYLGYVVENDQLPFDQYCGDVVYVKANEAIENNPELQEKRKDILRKIEECDPEISRFAREISDKVLRRQLLTAWRLGVEYDYLVWESDIIRSKLKDMGMKYLSKSEYVKIPEEGKYRGCVVVEVSKIDEFKGESDEVLVRSDGTLTYLCKDIFFAMWKLGLLNVKLKFIKYINQLSGKTLYSTDMKNGVEMDIGGCDYSINVIGSEQRRPQSILKYVLSSIFGRSVYDRYIHYAYEAVVLSKETVEKYLGLEATKRIQRMSGRKGIFINVDPFLDMLKNETYKLVKSSNPDIDDEVAMDIAEKIAISALRYSLLSVDRDKIVVFDINKMLDIRGESGAYILYSYARAMSILRKASSSGNPPLNVNLMNEHDINLIDQLLKFRYTLYLSAKNLEPKILCKYLYDLAKIFNDFYEKNPVIKAEEPVRNNRLLLVQAFIDVMKYGAELLGLKLVERM